MPKRLCFPVTIFAHDLTYKQACKLLEKAEKMPKLANMYTFHIDGAGGGKEEKSWDLVGRHRKGTAMVLKDPDAYVLEW